MPREGHDPSFLVNAKHSKEVGLKPKAVYRNLAPAQLYEMVSDQALRNAQDQLGFCLREGRGLRVETQVSPTCLAAANMRMREICCVPTCLCLPFPLRHRPCATSPAPTLCPPVPWPPPLVSSTGCAPAHTAHWHGCPLRFPVSAVFPVLQLQLPASHWPPYPITPCARSEHPPAGSKTGRSPKDKRVVREAETEGEIWRGAGSPNYDMDDT